MFNMHKASFIVTWFTDYHSPVLAFLSKLFNKPLYSIIGGYEVEYLPQWGYGGIKNPLRKKAIQYSLNLATRLFPVSEYTKNRTLELIKHDRISLIHNGIHLEHEARKEQVSDSVYLTVAHIEREQNLYIKGIARFFQMAKSFPQDSFIFVGGKKDFIQNFIDDIPENVDIVQAQSREELNTYYQKAHYYVQLSEVESFGLAVLEALSWGAIPIVSNRGALPELFGEIGIVINIDQYDTELAALPDKLTRPYDQKTVQAFVNQFDILKRHEQLSGYLFDNQRLN